MADDAGTPVEANPAVEVAAEVPAEPKKAAAAVKGGAPKRVRKTKSVRRKPKLRVRSVTGVKRRD